MAKKIKPLTYTERRDWRIRNEMTQGQVAAMLGCSVTLVSFMEAPHSSVRASKRMLNLYDSLVRGTFKDMR